MSSYSSASEFWFSLLFNIVSVPFVLLLVALVIKQSVSIKDYTAEVEANSTTETPGFVGEVLF
ncbi:MAG: hypothetical protein AAGN15_03520 [Cyanobacteria bacterium J06581_3]